jgi:hypothetical protein
VRTAILDCEEMDTKAMLDQPTDWIDLLAFMCYSLSNALVGPAK